MRSRLLSTEGFGLEAVIELDGQRLHVMDMFSPDSGDGATAGLEFDCVSSGFLDDESWEQVFSGNPNAPVWA